MAFFTEMTAELRKLAAFAKRVEADVRQFNDRVFTRMQRQITDDGAKEIHRLHASLVQLHYRTTVPPRLVMALRERAVNQWVQQVTSAFSVARDSIPEFPNPVRARNALGQPQSIPSRLAEKLGAPAIKDSGKGRVLFGVLRLSPKSSKRARRAVRMRLVPYLTMLMQTMPRNLTREFVGFMVKLDAGTEPVFLISKGITATSCRTCIALHGRVLTRAALQFATSRLNPQLFHPRCRHVLRTGGLRGIPVAAYDPTVHGSLVTLAVLRDMLAAGDIDLAATPRRSTIAL